MSKQTVETPLMKQYSEVKKTYPDAILLFRVGDFYETFAEDAVKASRILGITLTHRANGYAADVELAGFPHHAIDTYLPKLVRAGYRVAVCDQLEDPKLTKTLVKRGVTELVTPGVSYNDTVLDSRESHFVAGLHFGKSLLGVAFLDISTGEFLVAEGDAAYVATLLGSYTPKEVLYERGKRDAWEALHYDKVFCFELDDWMFTEESARNRLHQQFGVHSLKGFGLEDVTAGVIAAGVVMHYLDSTQHLETKHITCLKRVDEGSFVWMDKFTIRNLELFRTMAGTGTSLSEVLDGTLTPMGTRLLHRYIAFPLKHKADIEERQHLVEAFFRCPQVRELFRDKLALVGDMERVVSKVAVGRVNPREMLQLRTALEVIQQLRSALVDACLPEWQPIVEALDACSDLAQRIGACLAEDAPLHINRGGVIRPGYCVELDDLRELSRGGKDYLLQLQQRESERTGIPSLKISYNNVFGYYIEVRNTYKDKVPAEWIRKQTLVNAERYITEELKTYESRILGAEEKILQLETRLFAALVAEVAQSISVLQQDAAIIARCDVLCSFAVLAMENKYVCPALSDDKVLDIRGGRHPVIEKQLPAGEQYIANDVYLDTEKQQIIVITGPNMAGKSALLRQTALITLMAQIGSFVPAASAHIGLVDKIFTRVGAGDNISQGESTFMVEMNEAANILNNLSERSLVLFDELGRGTSTYDGISIAWAIVEYIHENKQAPARTLFATHYHELNEMEKSFSRIRNFNVSVREVDGRVLFLRKLVPGGSEHSFGIHVATLAGMPKSIVKRATAILTELEHKSKQGATPRLRKPLAEVGSHREGLQLSLFQLDDPVLSQVRDEMLQLDINSLTPLEALNKLSTLKKILRAH